MVSFLQYFYLPEIDKRLLKVWSRNKDVFMKDIKLNFFPPFLEPLMYLFAMGFGLGTFVNEIDGISYPQFIAPGLLAVSTMYAAFFECTYSSYVRMYHQKTFDAIIATPLIIDDVISGEMLWGATRSVINATTMGIILLLFGLVNLKYAILIIPFAFLSGLVFACIGMCFTAISPNITTLTYPSLLFITPMFLFSGTFFPLNILPTFVQYIALIFLPLTHIVNVFRAICYGSLDLILIIDVAWILIIILIFYILAINLMKKRLIL